MSDYSSTYPTQSPVFAFDAKAGKLDSRLSYSRSSTGTYMSSERHLSSLNLLTNSEDFTAWSESNATATANTTAAPDGTTTADTLTGNAGAALKRLQSNSFSADGPTFSFYAKAGTHNYIQIFTNQSSLEYVNFDLTSGAGAVGSSGSLATGAIQSVGSTGWYRCLVKVARNAYNFTVAVALVDSTSSAYGATTSSTGTVHLWGAMANDLGDLTNVVAYQSSGSQLHREFAPTLKTASADAARFEFDASGNAKGLLVESQATNLQRYGSDFASWSGQNRVTTTSNVAIAPNGLLEADLIAANTSATQTHNVSDNESVIVSGTVYTGSVYVKDFGQRYVQIVGGSSSFGSSQWATFDLQTGSVDANGVTASAASVGNGWYRIQVTMTSTAAGVGAMVIGLANSATATRLPLFTGNDYDGLLLWGFQLETGSASSLVDTGSGTSSATRAADSCSVATADFGFTGGPVTIVGEVSGGNGTAALADLRDEDATLASYLLIWKPSAANTDASNFVVYSKETGNLQVNETISGSGGATTIAVRLDTDNFAACADGGTLVTDTSSVVLLSGLSKLWIASAMSGYQLDSTIKTLRFYNVALSDTEMQAITS